MTEPDIFVPAFPTIRPEVLLQLRRGTVGKHYPFSAKAPVYFYFARNAIWSVVKELHLDQGEVLVPAYHHGVEIEALIDAGASVRFYGVGPRFEVDLNEVESLIGPRTKALYLTHFLGFPGPVREMKALAVKHGIPLIEDCALALFSADLDLPLGITGDAAIFCLYKVLAVPDGGILVYPARGSQKAVLRPPPSLASGLAVLMSSLLRNVALRGGRTGRAVRQRILGVGKGALQASRVTPVLAGTQHFNRAHAHLGVSRFTRHLLRAQDVPTVVSTRRRNYNFLLEGLRDVSPPLFPSLPEGVVPLCYPLLVDDNRWFMEQLVARGIEAVDFWREGHPACDISKFPDVARLRSSVIEIPCHQDLTMEVLARMVKTIREVLVVRALDLHDVSERESFVTTRNQWNDLTAATHPEPFYRHEYIAAFLDNFLPGARLKIVTGYDHSGDLVAALPLVVGRGSICGVRTRELASPTNVHSLRFDLIAAELGVGREDVTARTVFQHLVADPSWNVIKLTDIPPGGQAWRIYRAAEAAGFPVGAWESQRSPYLTLPASHDELMKGLSAKFRANLRRRRKRLAETGEITVERLSGDLLSARRLEECLAMEASGWKGRQGSAARQNPAVRRFHLDLLEAPSYRDQLSLHLLKLSGRPIAFHYGITSNAVFSLVMTSYDESFREFSPGHLLTEEVLRDCGLRGLREFDFLGCDLPWKLEWTSTVRPHHWLFIFRDTRQGRLLRRIKFGWAVTARQLLTRWGMRLSPGRASLERFA